MRASISAEAGGPTSAAGVAFGNRLVVLGEALDDGMHLLLLLE
jgi:hypothetical protein